MVLKVDKGVGRRAMEECVFIVDDLGEQTVFGGEGSLGVCGEDAEQT